jgi:hypothetical protein
VGGGSFKIMDSLTEQEMEQLVKGLEPLGAVGRGNVVYPVCWNCGVETKRIIFNSRSERNIGMTIVSDRGGRIAGGTIKKNSLICFKCGNITEYNKDIQ